MVHSICITFNYDRSNNTGSWVWVNNLSMRIEGNEQLRRISNECTYWRSYEYCS